MADASRHRMFYVLETDYGVTPENPVFLPIRHTGTTLGMAKGSQLSEELRADRQIASYRHGTRQIGGDINFELSYGSHDDLLQAVLGGTWAPASIGGAVAATGLLTLGANPTSTDTMTIGSVEYTFVPAEDFDAPDEIPIGATLAATQASVIAAINGTDGINSAHPDVSIGSFAGNEATITALVAGAAGNSIATTETFTSDDNEFASATLQGGADSGAALSTLTAGVNRRSFTILRIFDDMAGGAEKYHTYVGCEFNNLSLSVTPEGLTTGTLSLIGRDAGISTTLPAGADISTAPSTTQAFNGFGGAVKEGGVSIAIATEIQISLENGIEPRFVIGDDKSIRPSIGRSNLSGTLGSWFEDASLIGKFFDEENSSLEFTLTDPDGNGMIFQIPNVSFTGGQPDVSGQSAIPLSVPYQALYDPVTQTNIRIAKVPA